MKISTFNPQIFTNKEDKIVELFEELGFKVRHDRKEIGDLNAEGIRMQDSNGFNLDISVSDVELPKDMVGIRMNVDDFDEAYKCLLDHGFTNIYGSEVVDTKHSKSAVLISPTGFGINLVKHKKEKE